MVKPASNQECRYLFYATEENTLDLMRQMIQQLKDEKEAITTTIDSLEALLRKQDKASRQPKVSAREEFKAANNGQGRTSR